MTLSIIIPTYNEQFTIAPLLDSILAGYNSNILEVIIVDSPDSIDNILESIKYDFVKVLKSSKSGRAAQMNYGAKNTTGSVLYFVHADTILPKDYFTNIVKAVSSGYHLGSFRFRFDSNNILLKINSFFTRLPFLWCRGGDQSLFVRTDVFERLGSYDESFVIMEEYDLIRRASGNYMFKVMEDEVIVSARKYEKNGYFKIQWANLRAIWMFKKGKMNPDKIKERYNKFLDTNYI